MANDAVDNHPLPNGDVVMPRLNPTTEPSAPLIGDSGHNYIDHPILGTGDVIISQSYEDATGSKC